MSVFASLRRSVGFGGGSTSTSPIASKPAETDKQSDPDIKVKAIVPSTLANLSLENKHGKHKATYPIRKEVTKIGRLATNDIRIYRETVSRVHCEVHVKVEDSTVTASLHIFNPKGLKINGNEVEKETKGERVVPLLDGDLIEIYSNYFRMRLDAYDSNKENDENAPQASTAPASQGRKSIRMSLVRSKVTQKTQSDEIASSSSAPQQHASSSSERLPLGSLSCAQVGQSKAESPQTQASTGNPFAPSPSKKSMPKQGRRSLVFATPKRESISQQPWTAEPIKRLQNPISPRKPAQAPRNEAEGDDSIVFMEEIEEENDKDAELDQENGMLPNELDELLAVAPVVGPDTMEEDQIGIDSSSYARQTKSVSPKKVKRRSSFFGRAGVFANWNFGFYPEERKAAEEDEVDKELSPSPSLSPITSPNGTQYLPDPRLDSQGRPRLPRSLSSPDGLGHSSPKRRIVSLRTATLLRQGQNAFEQQKMRSPPSSPVKSSLSNDATPSLMGQMQQLFSSADQPKDSCDKDDEDEIDQSLSLADDEPEEVKTVIPASKPRKSDSSTIERGKQALELRKSRVSMPAKLLSIVSVDGHSNEDIEDLKKQWLAEQEERDEQEDLKNVVQDALTKQDEGHETDTDSENESEDETGKEQDEDKAEAPATPSSKVQYGMLRYMVRENAELTALLDTVVNDEEKKAAESTPVIQEAPIGVAVIAHVEETSYVEESTGKNDVITDGDGEWQIVTPRRPRWEPSERKPVENRRVSDTYATAQKKQRVSPKKKSKRRVTAAVTSSLNTESGSNIKSSTNEKCDTEVQPSEQAMEAEKEASAVSSTSPIENVQVEEYAVEQKSPKKRSPTKQSPIKRSPTKPTEQAVEIESEVLALSTVSPFENVHVEEAAVEQKSPKKRSPTKRSPVKQSPTEPIEQAMEAESEFLAVSTLSPFENVPGEEVAVEQNSPKKRSPSKRSPVKKSPTKPIEQVAEVESEALLESITSQFETVQVEEIAVEQKSPKKRSPSKQSPVKRSPTKQKLVHEDLTLSVQATEVEVIPQPVPKESSEEVHEPSSEAGAKSDESTIETKQESRSPLKSMSPSKKVKSSTVVSAPIPSSPKRLRSRSPVKRVERNMEEDDDKENEIPIVLQSSSPVKKTRSTAKSASATKPSQTRGRKKAKEDSEPEADVVESEPAERATSTTRRSTRTATKKTSTLDVPASEPAMPTSDSNVRTTRSGRSVRKPKDLTQPATVIAVQSDPVEAPAASSTGRVTRNRARKAAA
ncbi:uncharacterized protein FA14DRAFT_161757 [Meira miltonrushii]|uniref:FHA domain-containing protein n=1 Tax=Meira miltonrushii TaxID=1280837 RepID=A0A316VA03_9BASI|nr:uncharacterized protein FA14DRAFT_161757 [Meira miltonrushii]PWN34326.1 hypothetical protein FA14DRAFT_161757 [Meira miltonrushii]